jgi:hypothetical protein
MAVGSVMDRSEDRMSGSDEKEKGIDGHLFRLIATFEAAAMQQMGKIANPISGDTEVSLDGARDAIEMLDMLTRKTAGNLNKDETRFIEHVLYQLRMNYVDVAREIESGRGAGASGAPDEREAGGDGGDGRGDGDE